MITTQQTQTAPVAAKPSYSIVLYDPALLEPSEAIEKQEHVASKPTVCQKRPSKKAIAEKFKKTKKEFQEALLDIFRAGIECTQVVVKLQATIAVPVANAAVPGLAKILGTYRTYFDNADIVERDKLFAILVRQCKTDFGKSAIIKADKRTTEWHLLSRMFRQSDRRQASADAKILKFAYAEGVTEESFEAWVKKHGTLSNILKGISADSSESTIKSKSTSQPKASTKWICAAQVPDSEPLAALAALQELADGKEYTITIHHRDGKFDIMRLEKASSAQKSSNEKDGIDDTAPAPKEANNSILQLTFDPHSTS